MSLNFTYFLSAIILIVISTTVVVENISLARTIRKQNESKIDVFFVTFFSVFIPHLSFFSFYNFHRRDRRECFEQLRTLNFYKHFAFNHSIFVMFIFAIEPSILWEFLSISTTHSLYLFSYAYAVFLPISIAFAWFSYLIQLPSCLYDSRLTEKVFTNASYD